jgi:Zn-dependent protease
MDFSAEQIRLIFQALIVLVLSICVHEYGHAIVADKLGDGTPRSQGRTTLNPIAHADPIGTLAFPLIALLYTGGQSIGFGWGRPVMVNPLNFTRKWKQRTSHMLVAAAGPAMNILFGFLISFIHLALVKTGTIDLGGALSEGLAYAVGLNFVLAFFNLIPAPPLDGGAVLEGLLPDRMVPGFKKFSVYGPFVLMAVIFIPQLQKLFVAPAMWLFKTWYGVIGFY